MAGAAGAGAGFLPAVVAAACAVFGTILRAIGRGFGSGTFGLAQASVVNPDNPSASARLVANAVDRSAAVRMFTAFLRGESFKGRSHRSISLNMWTKY
jgi:hypothetical protein